MSYLSEDRPWGSWHILDEGLGYKVKRIEVRPHSRLSYQTHEHRSEHWVVVSGKATCVVEGREQVAGPGDCVEIALGEAHRIMNAEDEDLVVVEIQRGDYTGEDDICRLEDDYGRDSDATSGSTARTPSRPEPVAGRQGQFSANVGAP